MRNRPLEAGEIFEQTLFFSPGAEPRKALLLALLFATLAALL